MNDSAKKVLEGFNEMITAELAGDKGGRYQRIMTIAGQAHQIARMFTDRVKGVLEEDDDDLGDNGILLNNGISGIMGQRLPNRVNRIVDDNGELLRQIVDVAQPLIQLQIEQLREKHRQMLLDSLLKYV